MRRHALAVPALAALAMLGSCSTASTKRVTGQSERFIIDPSTLKLRSTLPGFADSDIAPPTFDRQVVNAKFGDPVRYDDDVVALQVVSVHLQHLPATFLGSNDVIVFSEVWENGAAGYSATPLNSIIHIAKNQMIPGRLSFEGNMGYGPTTFKGHPFKIRFTVMILQKDKGKEAGSAADVIGNFTTAATLATPYSMVASSMVGLVREILRAQPDVIAMDYEFTDLSHAPETLRQILVAANADERPAPAPLVMRSAAESVRIAEQVIASTNDDTAEAELKHLTASVQEAKDRSDLALAEATRLNLPREAAQQLEHVMLAFSDDGDPGFNWAMDNSAIRNCVEGACDVDQLTREQRNALLSVRENAAEVMDASQKLNAKLREIAAVRSAPIPVRMDSEWPWIRYGMYAIVETRSRPFRKQQPDGSKVTAEFALGHDDALCFDRGWLRFLKEDDQPGNCLETNYIVFALTPHQLSQQDEILIAASQSDAQLLATLRRSEGDVSQTLGQIAAHFQALSRSVVEQRANAIARKVAGNYELRRTPGEDIDTFKEKLDDAFDSALPTNAQRGPQFGIDDAWVAALKQRLTDKWADRLSTLPAPARGGSDR